MRGEPWHVYPEIFLRYAENAWKLSMFSGAELYVSSEKTYGLRVENIKSCSMFLVLCDGLWKR